MVKTVLPSVRRRHLGAMGLDIAVVVIVYFLALNFRYSGTVRGWSPWTAGFAVFCALAIVVHLVVNWLFRVYGIVPRFMSLGAAVRVGTSAFVSVFVLLVVDLAWPLVAPGNEYLVPRSVVLGGGVAVIAAMIGWRFVPRAVTELKNRRRQGTKRVLVVGAGQGADGLLRDINRSLSFDMQVIGLVDDDPGLSGMLIQGKAVLGTVDDVPRLVRERRVDEIIVAIPSATAKQVTRIFGLCKPAGVPIKILPSLPELISGTATFGQTRDLDVKDLLGRPVVRTDLASISGHFAGRTVLVTGAGGSIGSELCRQIARYGPARLVMVDHDESALYDLSDDLRRTSFSQAAPHPTNILQERKLDELFAQYRPALVFHAAAYKHVPLMELSPDEAILNNILGTLVVGQTAARHRAERFVNISTDKAVEPVNVMGATKRAGELIVDLLGQEHPHTVFASVRFGNVLGSQGSVIPIFKRQIEGGGPVTITHPGMTRYFMLIEEAVQLVLQAAAMLDGAPTEAGYDLHTFVLEMGEPVPIVELAERMIEFYWNDPERPVGIEFTGLRPGERLEEHLVWPFEQVVSTPHPLVMRVCTACEKNHLNGQGAQFRRDLEDLFALARQHGDNEDLVEALARCVPGYRPGGRAGVEKPGVMV